MAGQIKIIRMSTQNSAKNINISNVKTTNITGNSCDISFDILENFDQSFKMFLTINNEQKQEITTLVSKVGTVFTYTISNLSPLTNYKFYISLEKDNEYYFSKIYSFDTIADVVNVKYGIKVDESNSNPETCCTYIDDAIGIPTANSTSLGGWEDKFPYNEIKIVGFKNGQETGDINPNDKTKYTSGIVVPSDVDVMVKIPKVYWDFESTTNGYNLRIGNSKFNSTCDCYAHKVGGVEKDFIYVGAYLGYNEGGKLRSRSGVSPTVNQTIGTFRNQARANGNGYQQWNWFTQILLQNLYVIAYKNLNSQQALGYGYTNGNSSPHQTGIANNKGFIYGETSGKQPVCFLGIEDFYGGLRQWVDGMFHSSSHRVLVTPDNKTFNDTGSGYKDVGDAVGTTSNVYGKINKVMRTNEGGFFPKQCSGSDTTYYCDYGDIYSGLLGSFGSYWASGLDAGAFYLYVCFDGSSSYSTIGSRLVFLG